MPGGNPLLWVLLVLDRVAEVGTLFSLDLFEIEVVVLGMVVLGMVVLGMTDDRFLKRQVSIASGLYSVRSLKRQISEAAGRRIGQPDRRALSVFASLFD